MKAKSLLSFAGLVGAALSLARAATATPPPEKLNEMRLDRVRIARDVRGTIVTYESDTSRLTLWRSKDGQREKSCNVETGQIAQEYAALGLSEGKVLFVAHNGGSQSVSIFEMRSCSVVQQAEWKGSVVMDVQPARDGWLLLTYYPPTGQYTYRPADFKARLGSPIDVPPEFRNADPGANPGPRALLPIEVGGDVWLMLRSRYELWRPRQKGKSEWLFEPPECLRAERHPARSEQNLAQLEKMRDAARSPDAKAIVEVMIRKGGSSAHLQATANAAAYRDELAVLVQPRDGGCRLDVWNVDSELLLSSVEVEGACSGGFLAYDGEGAWIVKDSALKRMPIIQRDPKVDPCPKKPAKPTDAEGKTEDAKATTTDQEAKTKGAEAKDVEAKP